uniref:Uncharacterized protein n=1 Tax=Lactuca sativa TaxID=4236 RepID=A0A9R1WV71_LACSA|nr:hypothetical protein LSAT_V11C900502500 [Lactuca sativa]
MAGSHLNSIILILVSVSLASFSGNIIAEAQIPELPVVPKPELPVFPKPEFPMLPKPELPVVPKPEIHHGASGPSVHQCKTLNLIIKLDRFTESDKYFTPRYNLAVSGIDAQNRPRGMFESDFAQQYDYIQSAILLSLADEMIYEVAYEENVFMVDA